ncbi:MAG TPA: hypothetical protein VIM99_16675, partial [Blastocatellia bacterium]
HGRGVWIIDDITPLQQLDEKTLAADARLFDVRPGVQWLNDVTLNRYASRDKYFRGENPPQGTAISYYLKSAPSGDVKIAISDIAGKVVRNLTATKEVGLNRVIWDLRADPPSFAGSPGPPGANPEIAAPAGRGQTQSEPPRAEGGGGRGRRFGARNGPPLDPGAYLVKLSVGGKEFTTTVVVEADSLNR